MKLYKKELLKVFWGVLLSVMILFVQSCGQKKTDDVVIVDVFAHDINFTKRAVFAAQDSIGITIISDLKFKESQRERRNEVKVLVAEDKVEPFFELISTQSHIEYFLPNDFKASNDSITLHLKIKYYK